jgi:hypothetical protein
MIIESSKALGAAILFFPEGNAVQAGGVCSSAAIPNPNDMGWINTQRTEKWSASRKNAKYEPVEDGSTGRTELVDEIETGGYTEYEFTTNVILQFLLGLFYRALTALNSNSLTFNPDAGSSYRGWMILVHKDAAGNLIIAANLWGRLKLDKLEGGGGALTKPALVFTQYKNNLNVITLGS